MNFVTEALELEDTMKNYEHCSATGWYMLLLLHYCLISFFTFY